jgi:hypothetical protein
MGWEAMNVDVELINQDMISGLGNREKMMLAELFDIYNAHYPANKKKCKYYEGNISLNDVNIGIALPNGISGVGIGCA